MMSFKEVFPFLYKRLMPFFRGLVRIHEFLQLPQIERLRLLCLHVLQRCADGTHQCMLFGHNEFFETEHLLKRPYHAGVCGDTTLERNRKEYLSPPGDRTLEVSGNGEAEACDDVLNRCRDLLEMDHV